MADIHALGCVVDTERKLQEACDAIFNLSSHPYSHDPRGRELWEDIFALSERVAAFADALPEARFE